MRGTVDRWRTRRGTSHAPAADRGAPGIVALVRNGVDHDARVWRAAGVAEHFGGVLVIGAATGASVSGEMRRGNVRVARLAPSGRLLAVLRRGADGPRPGPAESASSPPAPASPPPASARGGPTGPVPGRPSATARLRRAVLGFSWTVRATRMAIGDRPAIVHANDWNTMWAGLIVKLMTGCALIYDSHELWADRNGRWEWRPWLIGCEWLFVHFADAVVTTSPGHAAVLARRYRIGMPEVVRNVPEQLAPPGDRQAGLLAYVGGMMPGRGLEQAIDALALMPEARLRAIGPGSAAYRESLRHRAQSRGVSARVTLADPVPANRVVDELSVAAAGLCLIQPICLSYELCLPNKLFEYVAAGLPVLCSDLPVMAQVVRENGLGALTPPDDVAAIAQRTRELLAPDPDQARRTATFARANQWSLEAPRLARIYAEWGAGQSAARA